MGIYGTASKAIADNFGNKISSHAFERMNGRCISSEQIDAVIQYGRQAYVRGATIYAIGKHEMEKLRRIGVNSDRLEGLQVVCDPWTNTVITAYRNCDLSSLRKKPRYYGGHHRRNKQYPLAA